MICDIIRHSKPVEEHYDQPVENEGFDLKTPLSTSGNKFSIIRNSIGGELTKNLALLLLAPAFAARRSRIPSLPIFCLGTILVWDLANYALLG
jgi:hypothetical protein